MPQAIPGYQGIAELGTPYRLRLGTCETVLSGLSAVAWLWVKIGTQNGSLVNGNMD